MPAALPIDWTLAKELYISGMSLARIAERLHVKLDTMCAKASRGKWKLDRVAPQQTEALVVQSVADKLSGQAVTIAERVLCKVERMPIDSPGDARSIASALAGAYGTVRRALRMDDDAQRHLHVHLMRQARASVIDVEATVVCNTERAEPAAGGPSVVSDTSV